MPSAPAGPRSHHAAVHTVLTMAVVLAAVAPARADIVHLTSGATFSVKSHRVDGTQVVLALRTGGEIVCPASLVERISPDEVPYPELSPAAALSDRPVAALDSTEGFAPLIEAAASRHGVDPRLLAAVVRVESDFKPRARSRKGAMGLMQLMPGTARQYAVTDPYEPGPNIDAGARHLRSLLDRFDLRVALAAYNAGEGAVRRFGGVPPYRETREYVRRILAMVQPPRR